MHSAGLDYNCVHWLNALPRHVSPVTDDTHYRLLKLIESNPDISQRELARVMGVSLGKANYCLKALVEKGFVKLENFRRNDNKLTYAYLLTPSGIEEKARVTLTFLRRKEREFEDIRREIDRLREEVKPLGTLDQSYENRS